MAYAPAIAKVVDLLIADTSNLKELALLSGRDIFDFYNGADLSNLDLSGQNLTGMNFERADLRFSNLDDIKFNDGAFNGAVVDENLGWIKDEYEFYIDDVINFSTGSLLIFCKIRPKVVDYIISILDISFRDFAIRAGVSEAALRKARNGKVIAMETAAAVLDKLRRDVGDLDSPSARVVYENLRQPVISFLGGGNNSNFEIVSRERLQRLFGIRRYRIESSSPFGGSDWRDTVEYLRYFEQDAEDNGFI